MEQLSTSSITMIVIATAIIVFVRFLPRLTAWGIPFLSAEAIKNRIDKGDDVLVIDVRSAAEFKGELGHVPGSLNLDAATLAERLNELGDQLAPHREEPVVVTCRTHNRSPRAARVLKAAGFKDVAVMKDGLAGWNRSGYPVSR